MSKKRRRFTPDFKLQVVREIEVDKPAAQAAREHQLHPNLIYRWKRKYRDGRAKTFAAGGADAAPDGEAKIAELERLIDQLTIENSFLKNVLARLEAERSDAP